MLATDQHQRIGSALIAEGRRLLSEKGVQVLFVYGDPRFYGRFGFTSSAAAHYLPPFELRYPFGWQAVVLKPLDPPASPVRLSCVVALQDPTLW